MKNNKFIVFHWAIAASAVVAILVSLSLIWQNDKPVDDLQTSLTSNTAQAQSASVDAPSPTVKREIEVTDKDTRTEGAELDNKAAKNEVIAELTPEELLANSLDTLKNKIASSGLEKEHPMFGENEDYIAERTDMMRAIKKDPLLLDTLLELFSQDPHSLLGAELAAVISATGSPKAQTFALDMATSPSLYEKNQRAAALLMIAGMEGITPQTRDGLLGNIQQETDSDLTQFSLIALKNAPSTAEDYANVQRVLNETLITDDPNVRRHASYQIGEWATSNDDLAPLRTMAIQDPNLNTRLRAVASLGNSDFKSAESKATLYDVVENDELAPVRLEAWKALKNFQLSDAERADYTELGERLQLELNEFLAARRAQ